MKNHTIYGKRSFSKDKRVNDVIVSRRRNTNGDMHNQIVNLKH